MNKKGISPLIATVLIIGFTIVLAALVITWGTNLFRGTVSATEKASQFSLLCTTGVDYEGIIKWTTTPPPGTLGAVKVTLTNKKQQPIRGFYITLKSKDNTVSKAWTTDQDTVKDATIGTPSSPWQATNDGRIGAFGTKSFDLGNVLAGVEIGEVRAIVELESTKESKVCDNPTTISITA